VATSKSKSEPKTARKTGAADTAAAVDNFMSSLDHPHKDLIEVLRQLICGAEPSIAEGIKWNSPSFRTTEYFATTHLRAKTGVGLVLHLGAKVRDIPSVPIQDSEGLLTWLGKDRAMINLSSLDEAQARAPALQDIVRQWIKFV
jgi:hypothetical protein